MSTKKAMFASLSLPVLLSLATVTLALICPPPEEISPCLCNERENTIKCPSVRGRFDLKSIFERLSAKVDRNHVFQKLDISGVTVLTELGENIMPTLKFREIVIKDQTNLDYIHPKAFNETYFVTESLTLTKCFITKGSVVFPFVSSFVKLRKLDISSNGLDTIPDNAFAPINGVQKDLTDISIANQTGLFGNMSIGNSPFEALPNLEKLSLTQSKFRFIPRDAFKFNLTLDANKTVTVDLTSSGVTSDIVEAGSFNNIQRTMILSLGRNQYFDYLKESVFKPLLDSGLNHQLRFGGQRCSRNECTDYPIKCHDPANDWICKSDWRKYKGQMSDAKCREKWGQKIFSYCEQSH